MLSNRFYFQNDTASIYKKLLYFSLLFIASSSINAQVNFDILNKSPTIGQRIREGQRERVEMDRLRMETARIQQETERLRIENEIRQSQLQELRRQAAAQEAERIRIEQERIQIQMERDKRQAAVKAQQAPEKQQTDDEIIKRWAAAAQPRIHLYPNFNDIVYARDLPLTVPIINLMSQSFYAADIAFYLGSNKHIATQISNMSIDQAQASIKIIEYLVRNSDPVKTEK